MQEGMNECAIRHRPDLHIDMLSPVEFTAYGRWRASEKGDLLVIGPIDWVRSGLAFDAHAHAV